MAKKNKKKTTRCTEKKKAMQTEMKTLYLPFELIIEILLRLPVKSLVRFKCVCKSWFSLISHPNFANSHFQIKAASRIFSISPYKYPVFQSIDSEINHDFVSLNYNLLLTRPYYKIKGSCRGFICLDCCIDIWIWNPSSGIQKQIPLSPFEFKFRGIRDYHLYGFGYDHSRDDYLVVILTGGHNIANRISHLELFSLRDNMWNEIGDTPFTYLSMRGGHTCGSFIDGAIHWLAIKSSDLPLYFIISFDLIERKLFEMPLPDDFHDFHPGYYSLWVFEEFLSLCALDYNNNIVEIWVMKEYKQHSSWTKTLVICVDHGIPLTKPVCGTKNGDIIGDVDHDRLVRYNNKGQLLKSLQMDLHYSELAMYTESLFSFPNDREQVLDDDTNKMKNEVSKRNTRYAHEKLLLRRCRR